MSDHFRLTAVVCAFAGALVATVPVGAAIAGVGVGVDSSVRLHSVSDQADRQDDPGACCDAQVGGCTVEMPSVCEGAGDVFLGIGTLCNVCVGGDNDGRDCTDANDCPGDPPGTCEPRPECATGACCGIYGICREIIAPDTCDPSENFLGFGTDCDPNCCEGPSSFYTGGDNCLIATPLIINVPPYGSPPVTLTVTGNNSTATFNDSDLRCSYPFGWPGSGPSLCTTDEDCEDLCMGGMNPDPWQPCVVDDDCPDPFEGACKPGTCRPMVCAPEPFDPEGAIQDPGWWEWIDILDCALLRIDFCCTDVDGDPWRPVWGALFEGCPCRTAYSPVPVEAPVGSGRGTTGFGLGAPFCDDGNAWSTYRVGPGDLFYPIYSAPAGTGAVPPGATYQLHITAGACPDAPCCVGDMCVWANEPECADLGGYWLYGTTSCGMQPDCDLPDWDSPCCTGSCCTEEDGCRDEVPGEQPMTKSDCDMLDGRFVSGPQCDDEPLPCPTCEIAGDNNCQLPILGTAGANWATFSDRSLMPNGPLGADDFISQGDVISAVCTWGTYMDVRYCGTDTDPRCDCEEDVTDNFLVRVYEDLNRLPGPLHGFSTVNPENVIKGRVAHGNYTGACASQLPCTGLWEYQLPLDTAITGLVPGQIYWIEISNNTLESQDCGWHWLRTENVTNGYSAHGINLDTPENDAPGAGGNYGNDAERNSERSPGNTATTDFAFCLDMNITAPPPVYGGCCTCPPPDGDNTCTPNTEYATCRLDDWDYNNAACSTACDVNNPPPGDTCTDYDLVIVGQPTYTYEFDNTCSDTDGPNQENTWDNALQNCGSDIWIHYVAPLDGQFYAHMCATGNTNSTYDSFMAVYRNPNDLTECACPTTQAPNPWCISSSDEGCNGYADGGDGKMENPIVVAAGDCLTVRAMGFDGEQGKGTVHMGVVEAACTLTEPPLPDPRVGDFGYGTRNRYLSFQTGSAGLIEAMKVTLVSLPPPYDGYNGDEWWVGPPQAITEASGSNGIPPNPNPPPHFWAATLQCGTPYYDDWTQYGIVHVYHDGIVPGAAYHVQAISDDCNTNDPDSYSTPLTINTSRAGDIVGNSGCPVVPCDPPQGVINFVDISACVEKFKNTPIAPQKARADVINTNIGAPPPDQKIDFVDIVAVVSWFAPPSPIVLPGPQQHCP